MLEHTGRIYGYEDLEKACALVEKIFGKIFFKNGIQLIKDSDPCGAGMGREYGGEEAARLFLAWHRVREELTFGGLGGLYRPGRYGALLGSLAEDLHALWELPGLEQVAQGLIQDQDFEKTLFLLFIASRISITQKNIIFPGSGLYCFYDRDYQYSCLSPGPGDTPRDLQNSILSAFPHPASRTNQKRLIYLDLTQTDCSLTCHQDLLPEKERWGNDGSLLAIVLTKTEFPSGTAGYYRKVTCLPLINEKTPGLEQAEGLINLNIPL
jgi:hypothetical protein